jgi:GT2 family glycosyltransferase
MRLTAIVPATDAPVSLARCVAAIEAADEPPDELIVVDSAPRPGPAAARNAGAERATGDVLVFVDADVLPHVDAFRRIRATFADDPDVAAVFGSYDDLPEERGTVSAFRNLLHHFVHQSSAGTATTFWAGLGAIRRDIFAAAGGFDADRYAEPSIEDIELGMRLTARGARIELDPALQGTHLKRWTLGSMLRTDFHSRGVPWVTLLAREDARSTELNLGWPHRLSAGAAVVLVASLATRRPRTAAAALATLGILNRDFYVLLWRKRGPAQAVAGVGLHVLHHLAGVCAVPVGLARAKLGEERARDRARDTPPRC